jgi:hypothetical protein
MLEEDLPLTIHEYDEWGNPSYSKEVISQSKHIIWLHYLSAVSSNKQHSHTSIHKQQLSHKHNAAKSSAMIVC